MWNNLGLLFYSFPFVRVFREKCVVQSDFGDGKEGKGSADVKSSERVEEKERRRGQSFKSQ